MIQQVFDDLDIDETQLMKRNFTDSCELVKENFTELIAEQQNYYTSQFV